MSDKKIYRYIFENRDIEEGKQDIPNPYIIEPPSYRSDYFTGDDLYFKFILLGNAAHHVKEVTEVLSQAGQLTLGRFKKRFEIVEILHGDSFGTIFKDGGTDLNAAKPVNPSLNIERQASKCSVLLMTPLRIRHGGTLVTDIDFSSIIRSITRRLTDLTERYGGYADKAAFADLCESARLVNTTASGLCLNEITRYSSRRNKSMDLSGLLGAISFEGEITPFTELLYAAQIFRIGRNTTFGCGKIEIVTM